MNFLIEHPYYSYLFASLLFGAYLIARFNPVEFRTRADNYTRLAEVMEDAQKKMPTPMLWDAVMVMLGFFWIVLIPQALYKTLFRIVFGSTKENIKKFDGEE